MTKKQTSPFRLMDNSQLMGIRRDELYIETNLKSNCERPVHFAWLVKPVMTLKYTSRIDGKVTEDLKGIVNFLTDNDILFYTDIVKKPKDKIYTFNSQPLVTWNITINIPKKEDAVKLKLAGYHDTI